MSVSFVKMCSSTFGVVNGAKALKSPTYRFGSSFTTSSFEVNSFMCWSSPAGNEFEFSDELRVGKHRKMSH